MIPKPVRHVDEGYLSYIRSLACVVCGRGPADAHHVTTRGAGGSDYATVPLCREHHTQVHRMGHHQLERVHGVDLWREVARCLIEYMGGKHGEDSKEEWSAAEPDGEVGGEG